MAQHKDLTGSDLHEPKGVSTASAGQVYVADGAGSGAWTGGVESFTSLSLTFTDISTAGDLYIACGVTGTITRIDCVLGGAITTADAVLSAKIDGVSVDDGNITVSESGSAAGVAFFSEPTGHNDVVPGSVIKITTDGASSTTATCTVTVTINV